ncbi:MAG TPA: type IV secretion system protein [Candidatus Binataceae bacterium]|nr:type IV secretion system protein [Candidatus Binataceae bacterium]
MSIIQHLQINGRNELLCWQLLVTLVEAYLIIGGGVLLLGLGGKRLTAPATEGYFGYVIRVGAKLLFIDLVLAVGVQTPNEWSAALVAACKPATTTLPWWSTYGVAAFSIMSTLCTGALSTGDTLNYADFALVFMIVSIAVPYLAAGIVGGTIVAGLSHIVGAVFVTRAMERPIPDAIENGFHRLGQRAGSKGDGGTESA